jgi:MoxR-like ATPase
MQREVMNVRVDDSLVDYALAIVTGTRQSAYLSLGVSPRGSLMLYRAAQAAAYLEGRAFATPEDFKSLAVHVFAHRVVVNRRYSSTTTQNRFFRRSSRASLCPSENRPGCVQDSAEA